MTAASAPTGPVQPGTLSDQAVTVTGTAKVGSVLYDSAMSPPDIRRDWQWYRSGIPIVNASSSRYIPTAADLGQKSLSA